MSSELLATRDLLRRAGAALERGNEQEAAERITEARLEARASASAQAMVGDFCVLIEDFAGALSAYDEAVRLDPLNPRHYYNRATVHRFLGHFDAAEADLDQVVERSAGDGEAWYLRSSLRPQTSDRNHVAALQAQLMAGCRDWRQEVPLRFALAKECEDLGWYDRSWEELRVGAALRRRHLDYDVRKDLDTVDWIREAFAGQCPSSTPEVSAGPIFIIGLPRTGSTLLERILAGHPGVRPAGELVHFAKAVVAAAQRAAGSAVLDRRALVYASARADFAALGQDYLRRCRPHVDASRVFVDKMPLNYLYAGLIARALPNARILHVTRHPVAVCHAIFKTLFAQGYPFSYDLSELADYYAGYRRLMDHWHQTMPGRILDVTYEDLVRDVATQSRRVAEHCGIAWDPDCANVDTRSGHSTTASAAQVRRPVYTSSVDLWRNFRTGLTPLIQRLKTLGIEIPP